MDNIRHDLRLADTVSPFGVGAIADVVGDSIIAADTSWWDLKAAPEVHCERLSSRLGGVVLRQAPAHAGRAAKLTPSLQYWRFPCWRFCERCGSLSQITRVDKGKAVSGCGCGGARIPMRYVAVCEKGSHIRDIPWFQWAHRGRDSDVTEEVRHCRAYTELRFERLTNSGEGLGSLRVTCGACKRSRSLEEMVGKGALNRDGVKCSSRQPWEREESVAAPCEFELIAVQRGATGNYIAERVSAIDIPDARTYSETIADSIRAHDLFPRLVDDNGGPKSDFFAEMIAEETGASVEQVKSAAGSDGDDSDSPQRELKDGEWAAFVAKIEVGSDTEVGNFVVDGWPKGTLPSMPGDLSEVIAGIGQVHRVREVRALQGFRRYSPESNFVRADLDMSPTHRSVLPAIELFGEGIFLRFDEAALARWEEAHGVRARSEILIGRRDATEWAQRLEVPEARFIALHTIAHLLIRRLAFASGYSSASLRERIYASTQRSDNMAGILIYTAAGDSQGTLGGLVRLGEPERFLPLLLAALDDADVCSNDPVCIESDRQGASHLNLSACHGCGLVSETSCEAGNRLLDRQLVLGGRNVTGLLEKVLPAIRAGGESDESPWV